MLDNEKVEELYYWIKENGWVITNDISKEIESGNNSITLKLSSEEADKLSDIISYFPKVVEDRESFMPFLDRFIIK